MLSQKKGKINYERLYKLFENEKVINQITFLKNENSFNNHMNHYKKVDIALDTFPYNGATTSFEAIWMSVPVLTIKGNSFVGRYGESINENLGLSDLVALNTDEYVNKMVQFSQDTKVLENLRESVFKNALNTSLFDNSKFTDEFEMALDTMVKHNLS